MALGGHTGIARRAADAALGNPQPTIGARFRGTDPRVGLRPRHRGSRRHRRHPREARVRAGNALARHRVTVSDGARWHIRDATRADALDIADVHIRAWEAAYRRLLPDHVIRSVGEGRGSWWTAYLARRPGD